MIVSETTTSIVAPTSTSNRDKTSLPNESGHSTLSRGEIGGIVGGIVGSLLIALTALFCFLNSRRKAMATTPSHNIDHSFEKRDQILIEEANRRQPIQKEEPLGGRLHPSNAALDSGRLEQDGIRELGN